MQHKLKKISIFLLMVILSGNIFAEKKPEISEYAFEKNILLKDYDKEVRIPMDQDILKNVKNDFSNFAIFNDRNENTPFDVYLENFEEIKNIEILEVSSMREMEDIEMKKEYIGDNNHFTVFDFSERIDRKNPSWVIFDLKKSVHLGRIEVFLPERFKISSMEIKAGNSLDNLKTIVAKKPIKPTYNKITLSTPSYRFVKVLFWGVNVRVEDIEFTSATNGYVYFTPKSGERYTALYGNSNLNFFEFRERLTEEKNAETPIVYFSKQKWNKKAKEDFDGDSINNNEDNCPFIKNSSQRDTDNDLIGDDCDNAPDAKNYDQYDTDGDGVGDIIDNCELKVNPDQSNIDNDEYGDVCDGAESTTDVVITKISSTQGIVTGVFFLIILLSFGYYWKLKLDKK